MTSKIALLGKEKLQDLLNESNTYGEVLEKIGLSVIANNFGTLKKYINLYGLSTELIDQKRKMIIAHPKYTKQEFIDSLTDGTCTLKPHRILKKLIEYNLREYKCEKCGISSWNGDKIILELHHKNGNHSDNKIENLEILCPNCHSQTDNFRTKNIKQDNKNMVR